MIDIQKPENIKSKKNACAGKCMVTRRDFLFYSSAAATTATIVNVGMLSSANASQQARVVKYPRKLIAKLSELKENQAFDFNYPDELSSAPSILVKTGIECGGGVGEAKDVVAFNYLCSHQGGPLQGAYRATDEHRTIGPCPLHLSLYDIRRHGIIVSGQAYESLPQVLLEIDDDDIYAVGMFGLIYGRSDNIMEENS